MSGCTHIINFFAADIISQLGSNIAFIVLHWYIIEITDSNEQVRIASMIVVISGLLTCPAAGILEHVCSRKLILIYLNYIGEVSLGLVLFLLYNYDFYLIYVYLQLIIAGISFNIYVSVLKASL